MSGNELNIKQPTVNRRVCMPRLAKLVRLLESKLCFPAIYKSRLRVLARRWYILDEMSWFVTVC